MLKTLRGPQPTAVPNAADGIRISQLERRALDDVALRAGCSLIESYSCCDPCWRRWMCDRLMEHLRGEQCWEELDRGDFAILRKRWHANLELVEQVVARIAGGSRSLEVLVWADDTQKPLDEVSAILRTLRVNDGLFARFDWLSWTARCGSA